MPRSIPAAALCLLAVTVASCTQTPQPSSTTAPVVSLPTPEPTVPAAAAPPAPVPTTAPATVSNPASSASQSAAGGLDAGADAQFRACKVDSDCVAVPREGCCHNGWNEAVNVSQKDAYKQANACTRTRPICPMYQVRDGRVARCDAQAHLCTMVQP
jgi:hypothetical protein